MSPFDAAVFIGRFQPPHLGHIAMLEHALDSAATVVVVLGSSFQARTPKNPFTWQERKAMIESALGSEKQGRVFFLPIADFYDENRWVHAVENGVQALLKQKIKPAKAAPKIALIAHFKDASSDYLNHFPHWETLVFPRQNMTDATVVRDALFAFNEAASNHSKLKDLLLEHVPASIAQWLMQWQSSATFHALQEEWEILKNYHKSWECAPYPPVFVTVDALVQCQEKILLVERGQAPGKGLLALPGGFLEQRDTMWQSCLRELQEETCIEIPEEQWRASLKQTQLFDHPDRSLRGRVITQVFHFDLGDKTLPPVHGSDDAKEAHWFDIARIREEPERFFDDHFHILEKLLGGFTYPIR